MKWEVNNMCYQTRNHCKQLEFTPTGESWGQRGGSWGIYPPAVFITRSKVVTSSTLGASLVFGSQVKKCNCGTNSGKGKASRMDTALIAHNLTTLLFLIHPSVLSLKQLTENDVLVGKGEWKEIQQSSVVKILS